MFSINSSPMSRGKSRRVGIVAGSVALLALTAACGNGSSSNNAGAATGGGGGGGTVQQQPSTSGSAIGTESSSFGTILTDSKGMTLYAFAADSKGKSNCDASCLVYWPPVAPGSSTKAPSNVTAKLGQITGSNGSPQLTVDGYPMYTYAGDKAPGDTTGQGVNALGGLWWVVATDGSWVTSTGSGSSSSSGGSSSGGSSSSGSSMGGY